MAPTYQQRIRPTIMTPQQDLTTRLQPVQVIIRYPFRNTILLLEALQAARSRVANPGNERLADGNRRLAMIGDAVLKLVLSMTWYDSEDSRGAFDLKLKTVITNENLDRVGRLHGLDAYIDNNAMQRTKGPGLVTVASTIEAILGAVYLDSGNDVQKVKGVMEVLGLVIQG